MVEHRTENPGVGGSIPPRTTTKLFSTEELFYLFKYHFFFWLYFKLGVSNEKTFFDSKFNYFDLTFRNYFDINGNHDYITIQSGVDNAEIGDTVVVYPGTYYENIILDKSIVLASLAIFDNLNNWFEYSDFTNQYEVTNDNVNNTIIDGSTAEFNLGAFGSDDIKDYIGSCIFIASFNEQCISPSVIGFTIQNGLGSITQGPEWYGYRKLKGGGILSYKSNANINFNNFINNGNSYIQYGGAIYFEADTIEQYNYWEMGGCELSDINIQNNFYNGNDSKYANTFSSRNFNGNILIDKSVFDVLNCSDNSFTEAWFDIHSESEAVFSEIFSNKCSVINDLWISPSGNDSLNDGSIENPLKTINYALEIINPSVENNITIHLTREFTHHWKQVRFLV